MARICAVITGPAVAAAEALAAEALRTGADLVEFRLDRIQATRRDLLALAKAFGPQAVVSFRPNGAAPDAETVLAACQVGFRYVDLDAGLDPEVVREASAVARASGSVVILSAHPQTEAAAEDVRSFVAQNRSLADVVKVAVPVASAGRALDLVAAAIALRAEGIGACLIGMGERGRLTRALADEMGSEIQYVTATGAPTAPGQFDLETARRLRRKGKFLLGVAGYPLARTLSPALHNAGLAHLDLPAVYLPLPVPAEDFPRLVQAAPGLGFRGLNVTTPHKGVAARLAGRLDDDARATGAVNTLAFLEGEILGHNTDVPGFADVLDAHQVPVSGKEALVLGAGGAARAVVHVLQRRGARVSVANRTASRAQELAVAFPGVELLGLSNLEGRAFAVVVNATPHDSPTDSPLPREAVLPGGVAIDLTYPERPARFLGEARERGALVLDGREMLLYQAARSFEIWTGQRAPLDVLRSALGGVAA
ncbi:MAG TPA: shikimate dehydrogenase [Thermoplasmata archaeon]|nr:shikimate dehydrogenase [Thermoplasmata archaeon]